MDWRVKAIFGTFESIAERNRAMSKLRQMRESTAFRAALLLLSLTVFAWGLNAKLSLYKTVQSPETTSAVKLSIDTRCTVTVASICKAPKFTRLWDKVGGSSPAGPLSEISVLQLNLEQTRIRRYRSREVDSRTPVQMRRPPPPVLL